MLVFIKIIFDNYYLFFSDHISSCILYYTTFPNLFGLLFSAHVCLCVYIWPPYGYMRTLTRMNMMMYLYVSTVVGEDNK